MQTSRHSDNLLEGRPVTGSTSNVNANIVFGLHNIGGDSRQYVTEFMTYVGGKLERTSGKVRIGMVESCGRADFKLHNFESSSNFRGVVNESMVVDMSSLLYNIRTKYTPSQFDDVDSDTFVILLVSGKIHDIEQANIEAMRLKYRFTIMVVGVDDSIDRYDLARLASYRTRSKPDVSHVFPVSSPKVLPKIAKKILALMRSST